MEYVWKVGGEAGLGIMSIGSTLMKFFAGHGLHAFAYGEYPSLIRGGHNTVEIVASDKPVHAPRQRLDVLVALNKETYELHNHRLDDTSILVYDPADGIPHSLRAIPVPFTAICKHHKSFGFGKNSVAFGASIALVGGTISDITERITHEFTSKGQAVVDLNIAMAKAGFDVVAEHYSNLIHNLFHESTPTAMNVVTGNDVFSLASVQADMRFYSSYPMTPASTVMSTLASFQEETGILVRHAEDELAAILNALGASFSGVRSAVGTSGGGFALMVESISLAGIAEMPLVIFLSMRPGPATGMPTWTEQGDMLFAVHAGHGEFPKIVLAPGDMNEMAELTVKAYNLADIYQTPVIVLSDKYLSESSSTVETAEFKKTLEKYGVDRGKISAEFHGEKGSYKRYALSDDGLSESLIPGFPGEHFQANSYSHLEDGHTTEEGNLRKEQVDKLYIKQETYLNNHFEGPKYYGSDDADTVFVCTSSTKSMIIDALPKLAEQGKKVGILHFTHIYPMNAKLVKQAFTEGKRYILVENNATGQLGQLLRMQTGISIDETFLKYDGRPIFVEEIIEYITK